MAKTDPVLGNKVKEHLEGIGLETVVRAASLDTAHEGLRAGISRFLYHSGLDIEDESIRDTPDRVAEMFTKELCCGLDYNNFPKCTTTPNGKLVKVTKHPKNFENPRDYDAFVYSLPRPFQQDVRADGAVDFTYLTGKVNEMVLVDNIQTTSLCEHHFQTIQGVTHIAYIPSTKLLGLSKFARVADFFARRPQVQERMTEQIFAALCLILETEDVAVQVVATHNCMRARGVKDPTSKTTTSKMGGKFMSNSDLRAEFNNAIPRR